MVTNNTTVANLQAGTTAPVIAGNLVITATQTSTATHAADARILAGDVGAGAAIAFGVIQGGAQALTARSMTVGGSCRSPPRPTRRSTPTRSRARTGPGPAASVHPRLGARGDDRDPRQPARRDAAAGRLRPGQRGRRRRRRPDHHRPRLRHRRRRRLPQRPRRRLVLTGLPLVDGGTFFVRRISDDMLSLHLTYGDAVAGTNTINLSRRRTPTTRTRCSSSSRPDRRADQRGPARHRRGRRRRRRGRRAEHGLQHVARGDRAGCGHHVDGPVRHSVMDGDATRPPTRRPSTPPSASASPPR